MADWLHLIVGLIFVFIQLYTVRVLWELYSRLSAEETGVKASIPAVSRISHAFSVFPVWHLGIFTGFSMVWPRC